ncbi:MAG TPA: glycosyltransferase family 39 protein [Streptosporangiaceae bacterium]
MTTVARPPESGYPDRHSKLADDDDERTGTLVTRQLPAGLARPEGRPTRRYRQLIRYLPLALILAGQAILTVKLARWAFASGDEGRYIYAGHQLIYELWHGGGSPYYETFFSGAPVIYPPLAAMADFVGGVLAVRLMSLAFMLTATCLLFGVSRRWFGYWPGVLAAGLFAGIGLTQDLGALGTYDALSLMLVAVAGYCAARTGDAERHGTRWLLAVPLALLLANATKYASALFDPVVIGIAVLQVSDSGVRRMALRVVALATTTLTVLSVAVLAGGGAYLQGVISSTFSRQANDAAFAGTGTGQAMLPARAIAEDSWNWVGAVVALCLLAFLIAIFIRRTWPEAALLGLLLVAGLLVTAEGIHLHSIESMYKHDDFGIWFTAAGAGAVVAWIRPRMVKLALVLVLVAGSGFVYTRNAIATYQANDSSTAMFEYASLKPYLELRTGMFLLGGLTADDLVYEDRVPVPWFTLVDDLYIKYPIPGRGGDSHGVVEGPACYAVKPGCMYLEGLGGYRAAIHAHWFSVISMVGEHYTVLDRNIENIVSRTPGYVRLWALPGPPTWIYAVDFPPRYR